MPNILEPTVDTIRFTTKTSIYRLDKITTGWKLTKEQMLPEHDGDQSYMHPNETKYSLAAEIRGNQLWLDTMRTSPLKDAQRVQDFIERVQ